MFIALSFQLLQILKPKELMENQNMATITASLERSLQNFSLNQRNTTNSSNDSSNDVGLGRSSSTSSSPNERQDENHLPNNYTTLELNSHVSLPYYWEQCLDLKTGEIYYINWRNGMRANEDPRTRPEDGGDYYYSSNDSEESSSELSPQRSSCRIDDQKDNVLVVGGCKSCLMYYMVPKHVHDCPKCNGQLLHFGRSENGSL